MKLTATFYALSDVWGHPAVEFADEGPACRTVTFFFKSTCRRIGENTKNGHAAVRTSGCLDEKIGLGNNHNKSPESQNLGHELGLLIHEFLFSEWH